MKLEEGKAPLVQMYDQYRNDPRFGTEFDFEAFSDAYFGQIEEVLIEVVQHNTTELIAELTRVGDF